MVKKLTFDELIIETTRRCNMSPVCPHCARGDPQPVDLAFEDIDALLNQVEQIYELQYTGGESTCNIPAIKYILQELKRRDIHLWSLVLTTNGLAPIETFIDIVESYANYISECRCADGVETKKVPTMVYVSRDQYHAHGDAVDKKIAELRIALQGKASVILKDIGNKTVAAGRALKNLDRSKLLEIPQGRINRKQIAIHDAEHKPVCMLYESFPLRRPSQTLVCCPVYISAMGNLISDEIGGMAEYEFCDAPVNIICNVAHPSFYDAILKYNIGKYDCLDYYIFHLVKAGDLRGERWKPIMVDIYVSTWGRVYDANRARYIRPRTDEDGALYVELRGKNGRKKKSKIAELVFRAWVVDTRLAPIMKLKCVKVGYANGNPGDTHLNNLVLVMRED